MERSRPGRGLGGTLAVLLARRPPPSSSPAPPPPPPRLFSGLAAAVFLEYEAEVGMESPAGGEGLSGVGVPRGPAPHPCGGVLKGDLQGPPKTSPWGSGHPHSGGPGTHVPTPQGLPLPFPAPPSCPREAPPAPRTPLPPRDPPTHSPPVSPFGVSPWSLTRRLGLAETLRWTLWAGEGPELLATSGATRGFSDRFSSSWGHGDVWGHSRTQGDTGGRPPGRDRDALARAQLGTGTCHHRAQLGTGTRWHGHSWGRGEDRTAWGHAGTRAGHSGEDGVLCVPPHPLSVPCVPPHPCSLSDPCPRVPARVPRPHVPSLPPCSCPRVTSVSLCPLILASQ